MKRRNKILLATVAIVVVAILVSVIHHFQLKAAVNRYKAELKAKGEPMDLAQVLPPFVPPEQNSVKSFLKAIVLLQQNETFLRTNPILGKQMVAWGKAMIGAVQPDVREVGQFGFTNSWSDADAAVRQNAEALALLRGIMNRPKLDFHILYEKGFVDGTFFTNLHLVELKKSALLLSSAAMADLHHGDAGAAVKNVRAALTLASAMQDQRLIISELVRIAMVSNAHSPTWEILQSASVTENDLVGLQNNWENLDFVKGYKNALAMEWACGESTLAQWRTSNTELEKYLGLLGAARLSFGTEDTSDKPTFFERAKLSTKIFLWRYWWSYPDELRCLRGSEVLAETSRGAETNSAFAGLFKLQQAKLETLGINKFEDKLANPFSLIDEPDFHSMLSESVKTLGNSFKRVISTETMKRMTITAIALKRYQLKNGNYPASLKLLTPEFISAVPLDPVDGQPLRYRLNADGTFLLYSIGENGKDDGGNPALEKDIESSSFGWQNPHALDWVWPQPATEAEIKIFYDNPPK